MANEFIAADGSGYLFKPCRKHRSCDECPGAYFDEGGRRFRCTCDHHTQAEIFAAHKVESKQRSLF